MQKNISHDLGPFSTGQKIVLFSNRGQGIFEELQGSRPRPKTWPSMPRTSNCVLEDSTSGNKCYYEFNNRGNRTLLSNTKQKATHTLIFFNVCELPLCKSFSCFTFFFLLAVCTAKPQFAAPFQPAAPGAEPEPKVAATPVGKIQVLERVWASPFSKGSWSIQFFWMTSEF